MRSSFVNVDGIRTHYLEAGRGMDVVMLHSGEFGGCAELSWEFNLQALARHFRVIAPDWLGFGRTAKLHDFENFPGRMLSHMRRFVEAKCIERAVFIGNSMGGSYLARAMASATPMFAARAIVLASGGGFTPFNDARKLLLDYDCSREAMKGMLHALFHGAKWPADEAYLDRRHELSLIPGAWECAAAARLKSPATERKQDSFGQPDSTPYELISVPTLIVAGANDKLRLPGYADELARRIPNAELHVFEDCGHCPNIERAERFNAVVIEFLKRIEASAAG
ncbi:MAG TPA: alpha/beta hydrolase [Candidatus Binataceae bacterium]|nr:alpha/beta hydrolase [Candidatus Binataceae bacterium]